MDEVSTSVACSSGTTTGPFSREDRTSLATLSTVDRTVSVARVVTGFTVFSTVCFAACAIGAAASETTGWTRWRTVLVTCRTGARCCWRTLGAGAERRTSRSTTRSTFLVAARAVSARSPSLPPLAWAVPVSRNHHTRPNPPRRSRGRRPSDHRRSSVVVVTAVA
jgi:hypothetical protein